MWISQEVNTRLYKTIQDYARGRGQKPSLAAGRAPRAGRLGCLMAGGGSRRTMRVSGVAESLCTAALIGSCPRYHAISRDIIAISRDIIPPSLGHAIYRDTISRYNCSEPPR